MKTINGFNDQNRVNPLKTKTFWAVVLVPVIISVSIICVYYLLPKQQTPHTVFLANGDTYIYNGDPAKRNDKTVIIPDKHPENNKPVTEIAPNALRDYTNAATIIIPDSVTKIGDNAFMGCTALTSVILPDSVTEVGTGAFRGCTSLNTVTLSENLQSISGSVFRSCTALSKITVPASVLALGSNAFTDCANLSTVYLTRRLAAHGSITTVIGSTFTNCDALTHIVTPDAAGGYSEYKYDTEYWTPFTDKICSHNEHVHI